MSDTTTATATTTNIQVTACDNELYILASPTATETATIELCHISSGYFAPIAGTTGYNFDPGYVLPSGTYNLFVIGINWGGPGNWNVVLTTDGTEQPAITGSNSGPGVWCAPVQQFTV